MLNQMDGIIVPTRWNRELFLDQGVKVPAHVLPHASQFEGEPMQGEAHERAVTDLKQSLDELKERFIFYSIGLWIPRKGMDLLLEAFGKAFTRKDPVALVLKTSALDFTRKFPLQKLFQGTAFLPTSKTLAAYRRMYPNSPPVKIFSQNWDDEQINALHQAGDAYVSLAKAEGWGLGIWEAAWFGKPLIATESLGFLRDMQGPGLGMIPFTMRKVPDYDPWRRQEYFYQEWAEPDLDAAVDILRDMVKRPGYYKTEAQARKVYLNGNFRREQIAGTIKEIMNT